MKGFPSIAAAAAIAVASFATSAAAFPSIVIKGSKFFYENNGTQFFIRGVAYQEDVDDDDSTSSNYTDPLVTASNCERDIPYLSELRTNTIRVYAIDPDGSHDECMTLLQDAGIYVIADLSAPNVSIDRSDPTWNDELYDRYVSVIDAMIGYPNLLGFFAGNEVSNNVSNTDASAFVKAAVRDMKAYIKAKDYRSVGIGYATNDDAAIRVDLADYFDCGDTDSAVDFWGYNIYSWCGDSSYSESGYEARTEEFADWNIPVFFAEYGCNTVQPRTFTEVAALYGSNMSSVWSGGIVYMYFQESNDYGLVTVSGTSVSTLTDFNYYSSEINSVDPSSTNSADYTPTNTAAASCPTIDTDWEASTNLPPTPDTELCECMYETLTCVPYDVSDTEAAALFSIVCGLGDDVCVGIDSNGTSGVYGAYSVCDTEQQLGWVLNVYYEQQSASGNAASACDFSGSATTKSSTSATGTCATLLSEAGSSGTGTVTADLTATTGTSSTTSGSTSTSKSAGSPGFHYQSTTATMQAALFIAFGIASGVGMVVL